MTPYDIETQDQENIILRDQARGSAMVWTQQSESSLCPSGRTVVSVQNAILKDLQQNRKSNNASFGAESSCSVHCNRHEKVSNLTPENSNCAVVNQFNKYKCH